MSETKHPMDGGPQKTGITSLPVELFQVLVDSMVAAVGLQGTASLRLVNKTFEVEVVQSLFRRGSLKPKTGRYDGIIPRNLYVKYILWRPKSHRGGRSHLKAAIDDSISIYTRFLDSTSAMRLPKEALMACLVESTADHVPLKRLQLTSRRRPVNIRRAQQGALILAVSLGDIATVKAILNEGGHPNYGTIHFARPLVAACRTGNEAMVELLLNRGAKISGMAADHPGVLAMRSTVLQSACAAGHEHIVHLILNRAMSDPEFDIDLETTLAARSSLHGRHDNIFKFVYSKTRGAYFDAVTTAGYLGNVEIVNMLLDEANLTPSSRLGDSQRCLALAVRNGRVPLVKQLLEQKAYSLNHTTSLAFDLALIYQRHEVVDLLLELGGPVNTRFNFNEVYAEAQRMVDGTPLIIAAENNDVRMMQILMKHGVDLDYQRQGKEALRRAKAHASSDAIHFLLDAGVKPKEKKRKIKKADTIVNLGS